jgi:hypothetical protein
MEKILEIDATAPGVVASELLIKGSINGVALGGASDDISQTGIRSVLCAGGGVSAPQAYVPFVIGVPLRARSRRNLFHDFCLVRD